MCSGLPLKILKICHLTYFILLNFINQLVCFQRISCKFNEVLNVIHSASWLQIYNYILNKQRIWCFLYYNTAFLTDRLKI